MGKNSQSQTKLFELKQRFDKRITDVEYMAKIFHEAGKEAVLKNAVVKTEVKPIFKEWDEISEEAREGRRIQVRFLMERFDLIPK